MAGSVKTNEDPQAPVCISLEEVTLIERKKIAKGCEPCDTISVFQNTCHSDGDDGCTLVSGEGAGPRSRWLGGSAAAGTVGSGGGSLADELALNVPGSGTEVLAGAGASGAQTGTAGPGLGRI